MHNLFPRLSPSVMAACRAARVPVVATIHNYRQLCPSGDLFRAGRICRDCVGALPGPAVVHGCYRGSPVATLPLAAATVLQRRAWRTLPSAYVFISEAQRDLFGALRLPRTRCFVKANLVPTLEPRTAAENLVAYVGRLSEAKGLRLLMRAWDSFERSPNPAPLRLVIAGSGPLDDEVRSWAAQRPSVDMVGLLSREECAGLLRRARAIVVPSEWLETFGLVVVEAMAVGVAPIAPAHGSFPELITDGVDGVLFPPSDSDALAGVLGAVAGSPGDFDAIGREAQRTYARRFDPEANVRELEQIYRFAMQHPVWLAPGDVDDGADLAKADRDR